MLIKVRDLLGRRGRKAVRVRDDGPCHGTRTVQRWADACMNSQKLGQHIQDLHWFIPTKPSMEKGSGYKVPLLTKKLFASNTCWERNSSFLYCSANSYITCKYPCSRAVGLHKTLIFCVCVCVSHFILLSLFLLEVFICSFDFCLFFLE